MLIVSRFTDEVEEIVKACPRQRQTLFFSATLSKRVEELAHISLNNPVHVHVDPLFSVADTLNQGSSPWLNSLFWLSYNSCVEFIRIRENQEYLREAILVCLCR